MIYSRDLKGTSEIYDLIFHTWNRLSLVERFRLSSTRIEVNICIFSLSLTTDYEDAYVFFGSRIVEFKFGV